MIITMINVVLLIIVLVLFFIVNHKLNRIGIFKDRINAIESLLENERKGTGCILQEAMRTKYKITNSYNSLNSQLIKQKDMLNRILAEIKNMKNKLKEK